MSTFQNSAGLCRSLLVGVWDVTDNIAVRLGINNVLDEDPPIASFGYENTVPEADDALGRYFFTGISVRL